MKYLVVLTTICFVVVPGLAGAAQTCPSGLAPSTPAERFMVNDDSTVTDRLTGLTWKQCPEGRKGKSCEEGTAITLDWATAQKVAATTVFAGKKDWRVPTISELETIIEYSCTMPAINKAIFPATPAANFWSLSPYAGYANGVWNINFNDGVKDNSSKNFQLYLRLVRGGK